MEIATMKCVDNACRSIGPNEITAYRRDGYLIVRGLVHVDELAELIAHTEAILDGNLSGLAGFLHRDPAGMTREELGLAVNRMHMLHRVHPLHERWLLHARLLDVIEVLIGPDVLALQSMLFIKPPGSDGQGWHQDHYFIPPQPLSLCGTWLALDHVDDENGGLWLAQGSHVEPIYPPAQPGELAEWGERQVCGIPYIGGDSDRLSLIADRYPAVLGAVAPGDCIFFHGSVLHMSRRNRSANRLRRAFVNHYCNARSFVGWGSRIPVSNPHSAPVVDAATGMTNGSHILARGDSHLPFALPGFGTPCAATWSAERRRAATWDAPSPADGL